MAKMRDRKSLRPVCRAISSLRAINCSNVSDSPGCMPSISTVEVNSAAASEFASRSTAMAR